MIQNQIHAAFHILCIHDPTRIYEEVKSCLLFFHLYTFPTSFIMNIFDIDAKKQKSANHMHSILKLRVGQALQLQEKIETLFVTTIIIEQLIHQMVKIVFLMKLIMIEKR